MLKTLETYHIGNKSCTVSANERWHGILSKLVERAYTKPNFFQRCHFSDVDLTPKKMFSLLKFVDAIDLITRNRVNNIGTPFIIVFKNEVQLQEYFSIVSQKQYLLNMGLENVRVITYGGMVIATDVTYNEYAISIPRLEVR